MFASLCDEEVRPVQGVTYREDKEDNEENDYEVDWVCGVAFLGELAVWAARRRRIGGGRAS